MKILSKKEGFFYNNKLLIISVLVLMVIVATCVVYATINKATSTPEYPNNNAVLWTTSTLVDFNCTVNIDSGVASGNITLWTNFTGTWAANATGTWSSTGTNKISSVNTSEFSDFIGGVWNCNITQDGAGDDEGNFTSTNFTLDLDTTAPTAFSLDNATHNNSIIPTNDFITLSWTATSEDHFINYNVTVYNSTTFSDANLVAVNKTTSTSTVSVSVSPSAGGTFADDSYWWYVKAYENASSGRAATASSQNFTFTIDNAAPTTSEILNPSENNTWTANMSIGINGSDVIATALNYTFYINGTVNTTGSDLTNNTLTFATLTALADGGYYNITLEVKDNASNKLNSSVRLLWYDGTAPTSVNITNLNTQTQNFSSTGVVTFATHDAGGHTLDYTAYINNTAANLTSNNASNGLGSTTTFGLNTSQLVDGGYYNLTIEVADNASNKLNSTHVDFWYDISAPANVLVIAPAADNQWVKNATISFNASDTTMNKASYPLNYTFYVNGTANQTGYNLTADGTKQSVLLNGLVDGNYYNISVQAKDYSALTNETSRLLWYDATAPTSINISLNTQTNNFSNTGVVTFSTHDGGGQTLDYTVYLNQTVNLTSNNASNGLGSTTTFGLDTTGLVDGGYYNLTIEVTDNASNKLNSTNVDFWYDISGPRDVSIITPATDNMWITSMAITFNATDDTMIQILNSTLNYTIYVNGTSNVTGTNLSSANLTSAHTLTGLQEGGYYNISVQVKDGAGNTNETSRLIYYDDGTAPSITTTITNKTSTSSREISFYVQDGGEVNLTSIAVTGVNASTSGAFNYSIHCAALTNGSRGYSCTYIEPGLEPISSVIKIDAKDNASNSADSLHMEILTTAGFKYNLSLAKGWNLVSTPLILDNNSISNIVNNTNDNNISKIYYFNGSWQTWKSGIACTSNCLTTMEPLKGYWIKTTATTTLAFFGNYTLEDGTKSYGMSYPLSLSASTWYTIGHYDSGEADNVKTDNALSSLSTGTLCSVGGCNFDQLYLYNSSGLMNVMSYSEFSGDTMWDRGVGFWIHITTADSYYR